VRQRGHRIDAAQRHRRTANHAKVISGTIDDISQPAALDALIVWALVPP
jgi:hypothetical protein